VVSADEELVGDAVCLGQPVEGIVCLSHASDGTAECVCGELAGGSASVVDLGDVNLHGCVVLGTNDGVGGRALPWDVDVNDFSGVVLHVE